PRTATRRTRSGAGPLARSIAAKAVRARQIRLTVPGGRAPPPSSRGDANGVRAPRADAGATKCGIRVRAPLALHDPTHLPTCWAPAHVWGSAVGVIGAGLQTTYGRCTNTRSLVAYQWATAVSVHYTWLAGSSIARARV